MRLRRQVAFDRLLARLFAEPDPPWLLKGGYAFDLRLGGGARTTTDLDLSIPLASCIGLQRSPPSQNAIIRDHLQNSADPDLQDGFAFPIGAPLPDLDA